MKNKIRKIVIETGVQPHLMGYVFTNKALAIIVEDYFKVFSLNKRVYEQIARECKTTSSRVERDIRNAIEVAFTKNSIEINNRYFRHIDLNKGKPTNKEYLAIIASEIINSK